MLVLIPARGGSRGVPGKNMKLLDGQPLIWYTIQKALYIQKSYGASWMVSTDCPITYAYALQMGGMKTTMRPSIYSQSDTSTSTSILYHIESGEISRELDCIMLLQPTNPFTTQKEIDAAFCMFHQHASYCNQQGLVSIKTVPNEMNAYWQYSHSVNYPGAISLTLKPELGVLKRRQDLPRTFFRSGSIYITSPRLVLEDRILGPHPLALCVDGMGYNVNIDTLDDWKEATRYVRNFCFDI